MASDDILRRMPQKKMNRSAAQSPEPIPPGLAATRFVVGDEELVVVSFPIPDEPAVAGDPVAGLTPAQQAIARMLLAGLRNADIAAARGTSPATVAKQVETIYRRLNVRSRAELAALLTPTEDRAPRE